jgi:hypothetical protein
MNQKDDDKATASLLLSTDEAVAEKIRRVLANNPDIIAEAMKKVEESLMIRQREAEYARALQNAMLQNQAQNTYGSSNTGMTIPQWLGGNK